MIETLISLDAATLTRLLGLLVPLLVATITKKYASAGLKGFLNLVASAVVGSLVYLVAENGGYDWTGFVNASLDTFMTSIIAYYGVLKPTGLAGSFTNATAGFGFGSPPTFETDDKGAEEAGDQLGTDALETPVVDPPPASRAARVRRASGDKGEGLIGLLGAVLLVVGVILMLLAALRTETLSVTGMVLAVVGAACMYFDGVPRARR